MNPLRKLYETGQSVWLDYIKRSLITSGELNQLIGEDGVRGMTSNPTIFEKAIAGSADYDETLRRALEDNPHLDTESLYEVLAIEDIQMAADVLRPIYDNSQGADGYVSLEVSPALAHDTERTIGEARRLWNTVDRPNLMIKVPATNAGIPAFESLIAHGVNVNVTLMFSLQDYENVAQAYLRGLEKCQTPERIASVASFFVSRVDSVVDKALQANGSGEARALMGRIAVANAKLAYRRFQEIFYGDAFAELKSRGGRVQRPLWASTSTKNPDYNDVLYVEELIGPDTVNTLPPATLVAFRDHGKADVTVTKGVDEAEAQVKALADFGIDFDDVTEKLQVDGVAAFAKSYEELLAALKKKRRSILASRSEDQYLNLGGTERGVRERLASWESAEYAQRLWKKDATLWASPSTPEITNRLGWLELPGSMHDRIDELTAFSDEIRAAKFDHCVLCGMGGSSLAPEVYQSVFGNRRGHPELTVLDSTHPAAVATVAARVDPQRTLFIVSSKSGTTTETMSFFRYFWSRVASVVESPGDYFVAITDPGTPLEQIATERRFRHVFRAPVDVGGRYSALSEFGLVPAAAIGMDVHAILDGAWAMQENTGARIALARNPALRLGAAIGELALAGRDKLTLVASRSLRAFPAWVEQLIAESTGKDGKGIVPVVEEWLGSPDVYGRDRAFVYFFTKAESAEAEAAICQLEEAGNPVIRIQVGGTNLLGQEFFRWEMATAAAGSILGIHPFNQPDVQLAKKLAKEQMAGSGARAAGADDGIETLAVDNAETGRILERWLGSADPGDYLAIHAYLPPTEANTESLQAFRHFVRDRYRVATTLGYGPRFLHSTGQLHKGGANNGLFLQIVDDITKDLPVPEADFTFGQLIRAQAMGDALALRDRGRRVRRIHVGSSGPGDLVERLGLG